MRQFIRLIVVVTLTVAMSGCFGLAHVQVTVPPLEIKCTVLNATKDTNESFRSVLIVVPDFYGESEAFASLVNGNITQDALYQWQKADSDKDNKISASFHEERRYIGSMFPFSPSRDTMESRTLFIWPEGSSSLYRIKLHGNQAITEKTDIKILKESQPAAIKDSTKNKAGISRETEIEHEIAYYRNAKWSKAERLKILENLRSKNLDKLIIELKNN